MENTNKKNMLLGIGAVVVIVAIILIVTLTGKKKTETVPVETNTTTTTQTQTTPTKSTNTTPAKSSFSFSFPTAGSTLKRGSVYTVTWTGAAECYDLGYVLNPKKDTSYNFIGKACKTGAGTFSYKWTVPPNIVPGTYGLELRNSGSTTGGTDGVSFFVK